MIVCHVQRHLLHCVTFYWLSLKIYDRLAIASQVCGRTTHSCDLHLLLPFLFILNKTVYFFPEQMGKDRDPGDQQQHPPTAQPSAVSPAPSSHPRDPKMQAARVRLPDGVYKEFEVNVSYFQKFHII